ncbi:copper amine oxidase [Thozetella sp. PMI_491]|nr:copper amine oxidase [Thozetella sp. PMI_491]
MRILTAVVLLGLLRSTSGVPGVDEGSLDAGGTCPAPVDVPTVAAKASPFQPLNQSEIAAILAWVESPARGLNLTNPTGLMPRLSDNYVWHMEVLKPNKTDVLAYLNGNASSVPRHARVVINRGAARVPDVTEYFVGPLPISPNTKIQPLDYFYNGRNGPRVLFNGRYPDGPFYSAIDALVVKTMLAVNDIVVDLVGIGYWGRGDPRTNGTYYPRPPLSTDGTTGNIWIPWFRAGLPYVDVPADLYMSFNIVGTDPSLWSLRMIVYNLVVYNSTADFRAAWTSGKIIKSPKPTTNTTFAQKDRFGPVRELENHFAPTVLSLDSKRFKVDKENRYVEYLGWQFYTRFDRDVGIQFYDIRYKGERIIYELSLQDAAAQYAGNNPFHAGSALLDRHFGIGSEVSRLIPGYDCPYGATYWNATFTDGLLSSTIMNAICIFETDIGVPITRHDEPRAFKQATKGSKLVVRQIATVGNYDYLFDYSFLVDGSIGIDVHASGYLLANYFRPSELGQWGPRIQETLSGALHTHVMNFKVDFDLIDANNSLLKTEIVVENVTQPWFPERGAFEMMRYRFTEVATEKDGILPVPPNGEAMYTIQNKARLNQWGLPRGYRIIPGLSNVHLASQLSPFFLRSGQFVKQAFSVTRQHDTEPASSACLNQNVPEAPLVEFWKFFNGESLVQQDIVAWVNLGMQHYTRSEDIPNTLTSQAHSSIMFAPQNWGTTEGTVDLSNAIIYKADQRGIPDTNGVNAPSCMPVSTSDQLVGLF